MRLHILAYDGTEMDETHDAAPEKWLADAYGGFGRDADGRPIVPEFSDHDLAQRNAFQAEILIAVEMIRRTRDDALFEEKADVLASLAHKCWFYWMTSPVMMRDFDEKSKTHDGFVQIFDDHAEVGWQERRVAAKLN